MGDTLGDMFWTFSMLFTIQGVEKYVDTEFRVFTTFLKALRALNPLGVFCPIKTLLQGTQVSKCYGTLTTLLGI